MVFDYTKMYFRYVSAASGVRGEDGEWVVGKKLERGEGVSFKLIDNTPQAPWVDIDNCLTYVGPERTIPSAEGEDPPPPPDEEDGPQGENRGLPQGLPQRSARTSPCPSNSPPERSQVCSAWTPSRVPRVAAVGPSPRRTRTSSEKLRTTPPSRSTPPRRCARRNWALAAEEQAAIAEALAATEDPKPELADGEDPPPNPSLSPTSPRHPRMEKTRTTPRFASTSPRPARRSRRRRT